MSNEKILAPEGDLLNLLEEIGALAWRKYRVRYPELRVGGRIQVLDQSAHPPSIAFRFERESDSDMQALRQAVESYDGDVAWEMEGRERDGLPGVNWVIRPVRTTEVIELALSANLTPDQYIAKFDPGFGPIAYDDLVGLTTHVRYAFPRLRSRNL